MSEEPKKTPVGKVIMSTVAAFVGVQSEKNRTHDFQQSSILPFLLVGMVMAALFIGGLVLIAKHLAP
jgi:hypothetical protein